MKKVSILLKVACSLTLCLTHIVMCAILYKSLKKVPNFAMTRPPTRCESIFGNKGDKTQEESLYLRTTLSF